MEKVFRELSSLFLQFAFALQILCELLPLGGSTDAVGLHSLIADELRGIAVLEIVAVVDNLPPSMRP